MNSKKYLTATASGFAAMFILGYVGHEYIITLFSGAMDPMESIMKSEPNILGIAVAYIVLALLMAFMYPKGIEGTGVLANGLKFGILIGLIFQLPMAIIHFSVIEGATISIVFAECIWHMIEQRIGGIAIAYGYGASVLENT